MDAVLTVFELAEQSRAGVLVLALTVGTTSGVERAVGHACALTAPAVEDGGGLALG
jgi:hypothetical protein